MRLICPNCDAQYEVPAEVMPPEGRDVQCANCGLTWFQNHPDYPAADAPEAPEETRQDTEAESTFPDGNGTEADETAAEPATPREAMEQQMPFTPRDSGGLEQTASRRELDPSIADVLRAEAEMEARARRKEASGVESQPDLGLVEASKGASSPGRKMPDYPPASQDPDMEDEPEAPQFLAKTSSPGASPRDLFPDIEEINSTLRSNEERSPEVDSGQTAQIEEHEKRNSRLGFSLTLALAAALALAYVYAPLVIDAIPQAEPILTAYVGTIDTWRGWLDTRVSEVLSWLDAAAASSSQE